MKKKVRAAAFFLLFGLLSGLLFGLCACKVELRQQDKGEDKPYVVCTVFPQYDFLRNIVSKEMELELLVPADSDIHSFGVKDLSTSALEKLFRADMIVYVGGESDEDLIAELKKTLSGEDIRYVALTGMVKELLLEESTGGMQVGDACSEDCDEDGAEQEHDRGLEEEEYDEHVWTSPKRALELVEGLTESVCALDPAKSALYRANAEAYKKKLQDLDGKYTALTDKKQYDTLIFADRYPFRYLCADYGLRADAAFAGCSSATDPSLAKLEYLYEEAERLKLPAILYMEESTPSYAEGLAKSIGGEALMLHSCHILSPKEMKSETYLSLMEKNLDVLKIALGAGD